MGVAAWLSIGAGAVLVTLVAWVTAQAADDVDPTMRYEGMVAVGLGLIVYGSPIWFVQVATAVVGGLHNDSVAVWLGLLLWAFLSPGVAVSPPARALARLVLP